MNFSVSREEEIAGLMKIGTFKLVPVIGIPNAERIFGMRFVHAIKTVDGISKNKSRLVDQNLKMKGTVHIYLISYSYISCPTNCHYNIHYTSELQTISTSASPFWEVF